jgi:serine/threonine-protein kinase
LRTLGTTALERDEVAVGGPATQRRRIALLALLAVAADLGVTRDKLVAYLWPERDERARHLLNQMLYSLRRELGEDELFLGTDPLSHYVAARLSLRLGERDRALRYAEAALTRLGQIR